MNNRNTANVSPKQRRSEKSGQVGGSANTKVSRMYKQSASFKRGTGFLPVPSSPSVISIISEELL